MCAGHPPRPAPLVHALMMPSMVSLKFWLIWEHAATCSLLAWLVALTKLSENSSVLRQLVSTPSQSTSEPEAAVTATMLYAEYQPPSAALNPYAPMVPSDIAKLPKSTTDAPNMPSPARPSAVNVARSRLSPSATEARLLVEGKVSVAVKLSNVGNAQPAYDDSMEVAKPAYAGNIWKKPSVEGLYSTGAAAWTAAVG